MEKMNSFDQINSRILETAVTKEELISFMASDFIWLVNDWFYGAAMGNRAIKKVTGGMLFTSKWRPHQYKRFLGWLDKLHKLFPQKSKTLYRLISQPSKKEFTEDSVVTLETSINVVQSWSDNYEAVEQFYKDVYKTRDDHRGKQFLIVRAKGQPLTTSDQIRKILTWVMNNTEKYAHLSEDPWLSDPDITNKAKMRSFIQSVKSILKRLNSKMIRSQREQIVYVPRPIKVRVLKVFN